MVNVTRLQEHVHAPTAHNVASVVLRGHVKIPGNAHAGQGITEVDVTKFVQEVV